MKRTVPLAVGKDRHQHRGGEGKFQVRLYRIERSETVVDRREDYSE